MLCELSDVGQLSDARQKQGPMIVPLLVPLWFTVDLAVEKRGCRSVSVRINHGAVLHLLCIGAVMVQRAV